MAGRSLLTQLASSVGRAAVAGARTWLDERHTRTDDHRNTRTRPHAPRRSTASSRSTYPGDYPGLVDAVYAPENDGEPDPGEVVWAWVPYEEDHTRGKDRPALVVGHDGPWLLALPMTSKDHDRDHEAEARAGRFWMDIGSGSWDSRGRPSEVRLDRVVRLAPSAVRREGAAIERALFDEVVAATRRRR